MLVLNEVSKSYGNKVILDNLSIVIPKGKITSFIGANGAGKSTVFSIISGLIKKNHGTIFLDDKDINLMSKEDLAKKMSILMQSNNLNARLTIEDLVVFGRFPYSKGRLTDIDKIAVQNAIDYVELDTIKHMYLHELSGGQRQRAFIAMVIAQDTDYILLDEPLNNLDMKHSVQIMKILRKLTDELGKTVVIVIHEINFASCYSDYIATMKNGKISNFGNTKDIIEQDILKDVFDLDFTIEHINDNKICIYYS
jgi:iron complex transport system ATP-binding protein